MHLHHPQLSPYGNISLLGARLRGPTRSGLIFRVKVARRLIFDK
jgi:hypothetical protein